MRAETFHTPGSLLLSIRVGAGTVELETLDGDTTHVEVEGRGEDEFRIELHEREGRAEVLVESTRKRFGLDSGDYRVAVRAPHGADAAVKTGSGSVEARGRYGDVEVQTGSGDVEIEEAVSLEAKSGSGGVTAGRVAGRASVLSGSGDVEVERLGGQGNFKTASGDVVVGEAETGLSIYTASGDQTVRSAASGELTLRAASGDLEVGIRRGSRLFVDARSASGDMESELELGDEPPSGEGPLVKLNAATASGDVRVVRA